MAHRHDNISVDETATAAYRGVSHRTQVRHRESGLGPRAFKMAGRWRYWLRDLEAERDSQVQKATA